MNKRINRVLALLAVILVIVVAVDIIVITDAKRSGVSGDSQPAVSDTAEAETEDEAEETTEPLLTGEVTIVAVGDNLIHDTLIEAGKQEDGSYNYDSFYTEIKPYIEPADIAIINQETILGGEVREYSGYPMFNSPQEIGDAAVNAGFDIFTCATNHAMDVFSAGIESELDYFDTKQPQVVHLGLNRSEEDYNTITYYEKNNIKFALLNYTYGTNGISLPDDKPWIVNLLDKEKVTKDITEARQNADVVVVFPHWGEEYNTGTVQEQRDYVQLFSDLGVDIVIGCHPHVIEPVEWVTNETTGHKMLVYYSLGNFISHQRQLETLIGGMAELTVKKEGDTISITNAKLAPVVTWYSLTGSGYHYKVYRLKDYTEEMADSHVRDFASPANFRGVYEEVIDEEFRTDD